MATRVELLWWRGCPSTPEALSSLRAAMAEAGLDPEAVQVREIRSDEQAERDRFPGSPTILVDGRDVQPPGEGEPRGLTCRVYHMRDGAISAVPDPEDIRQALAQAIEGTRA